MQALSWRESSSAFHHDKLAKATPYLLLKAVFQFPLNHEGNLPNPFCSFSSKEKKECHHLNLERTNKVFIEQKVEFRKKNLDNLFVSLGLEQDGDDCLEGYGFPFIQVCQETVPG